MKTLFTIIRLTIIITLVCWIFDTNTDVKTKFKHHQQQIRQAWLEVERAAPNELANHRLQQKIFNDMSAEHDSRLPYFVFGVLVCALSALSLMYDLIKFSDKRAAAQVPIKT